MSPPAGRLTALARTVDIRVPSNRFAVLAATLATTLGLVGTLATSSGAGVLEATGRGVRFGAGAFLAWAIARELDPDRPRAAALGLLTYLPAMALGTPALAALTAVLLAARVTVRSTGAPPTLVDLVGLVVLAGLAATSATGVVAALGLAYAIHADRHAPRPAPDRPHEVAAVAAAAVAVAVTVVTSSSLTEWRGPDLVEGLWLAVGLVAAWRLRRPATVVSRDDRGAAPLEAARLVRARRLVVTVAAVAVVWAGGEALPALAPAVAALVGTAAAGASRVGVRLDPPAGAT